VLRRNEGGKRGECHRRKTPDPELEFAIEESIKSALKMKEIKKKFSGGQQD